MGNYPWKAPDYYEKYEWEMIDSRSARRKPTVVELAPDGSENITLVMLPFAILYGQILGPKGKPMANRTVSIVPGLSHHWISAVWQVTCDKNGMYEMYTRGGGTTEFAAMATDIGVAPYAPVELIGGKKARLDFRLRKIGWIEGRVYAPNGKTPMSDAFVKVENADSFIDPGKLRGFGGLNAGALARSWDDTTDRFGRFRIALLSGKEYTLRATVADIASPRLKVVLQDNERRMGVRLVLSEPRFGTAPAKIMD